MKYSELNLETLMAMSYEEKWNIVCGNIHDDGQSGDVALLLGGNPLNAINRAHTASKLYHEGRVRYIVSSGGVTHEYNGELITEAKLMAGVMQQDGVPERAIILDNEARTTKENMICGTLAIYRELTLDNIEHVIIVTSQSHMQRSLALAKALLPRKFSVSGYPYCPEQTVHEYIESEQSRKVLDTEIRLTKGLVDTRIIDDIKIF